MSAAVKETQDQAVKLPVLFDAADMAALFQEIHGCLADLLMSLLKT